VLVWFEEPVDGGAPAPLDRAPTHRWQRNGDSFETLTLLPELHVNNGHGRWKVVAGDVIAA
jgi:hypothetical protein